MGHSRLQKYAWRHPIIVIDYGHWLNRNPYRGESAVYSPVEPRTDKPSRLYRSMQSFEAKETLGVRRAGTNLLPRDGEGRLALYHDPGSRQLRRHESSAMRKEAAVVKR